MPWIDKLEQAKRNPKLLEQRQRIEKVLAAARGLGRERGFFRRWKRVEYVLQFAGGGE